MLLVIHKLTVIDRISNLQNPMSVLFTILKVPIIVISIGPIQNSLSMVNSVFDATLVSRTSTHVYVTMLILSDILVVVALIDVSWTIHISAMSMFLTLHKISQVLLSQINKSELSVAVKGSFLKIPFVLSNKGALLVSFIVSLPMVDAVFESTGISCSILVGNRPRPLKFVVFEEASVLRSIFAHEVRFAYLTASLDWPFVTWAVSKSYLAMHKPVISKQTNLLIAFSDQLACPMVFMISHLPIIWVSILFIEYGVSAVAICEVPLQEISIAIVNSALTVLFPTRIDFSLVITTIIICYLGCLCSHQINYITASVLKQSIGRLNQDCCSKVQRRLGW